MLTKTETHTHTYTHTHKFVYTSKANKYKSIYWPGLNLWAGVDCLGPPAGVVEAGVGWSCASPDQMPNCRGCCWRRWVRADWCCAGMSRCGLSSTAGQQAGHLQQMTQQDWVKKTHKNLLSEQQNKTGRKEGNALFNQNECLMTPQHKNQIGYRVSLTRRKEGNVLFNDTLNTFYLRLYGVGHTVKDHSDSERRNPLPPHWQLRRKEMFYLMTHSTHFIYGYMASDI